MIALIEAARAGLFTREQLARNIVAGAIVGIVALPLSMAFAIASGVKPEQGIYTAIIAGASVSLLGGTRLQIAGPTGAFVVILAGITAQYGVSGLLLATFMAGAILVLLGTAKFGVVLRYIPDPVIVGFTSGIAVVIFVSQWKDFLGLSVVAPATLHFHERLLALIHALPSTHLVTAGLGTLSLALAVFSPRLPGMTKVPGPVVALLIATLLQTIFGFEGVATVGSVFGSMPRGLPQFGLPHITPDQLISLAPAAFTIAMLGAIESLLSAVVVDGMAGTKHDSNQELIGQGIANLLCPLLGGFAATGAIARTATNFRNGATGPLAGIVHAITLLLILVLLAPFAERIPLCALAAILFLVAWNMSDAARFSRMTKTAPTADVIILIITFGLTVFADLVVAVNVGVILAMMLFLRRMSSSVEVQVMDQRHVEMETRLSTSDDLQVLSIEGPLFFGAAENLERALSQAPASVRNIIVRLKAVPFMDITGIRSLEDAMRRLRAAGVQLTLCEARGNVLRKLVRAGLVHKHHSPIPYFRDLVQAVRHNGGSPLFIPLNSPEAPPA